MDQIKKSGPNKTEIERMNRIGPMWTEKEKLGPNRPNRTKAEIMDRVEPKWTE